LHVAKEEAASPTVALESVFVTCTIDARENREVVTLNIPGAFLHAPNKDYVVMRMNGTLAELMAKIDPKLYRKYLTDKKGKKVLCLRLQKVLYGMMKSAQFFTKNCYQSSNLWAPSSTHMIPVLQIRLSMGPN
jgi:hypothetical protein